MVSNVKKIFPKIRFDTQIFPILQPFFPIVQRPKRQFHTEKKDLFDFTSFFFAWTFLIFWPTVHDYTSKANIALWEKELQNRKNLSVKWNFWKYFFDITTQFNWCFLWQILNLNFFFTIELWLKLSEVTLFESFLEFNKIIRIKILAEP